MRELLYLLPILACPLGMGLMMWIMMRSKRHSTPDHPSPPAPTAEQEQELGRLRKEVDALRGELDADPRLRKDASA
ncbi:MULTISPECIES: hypothetical protein [Streptomyces]|uniref:hypothetical protein n=1 Tax=Streptomyces TaxID=1883 RepID=UPI0022598C2F|nr:MULTISPECIES: hypothetical protein [Streptomyces]MCX5275323.1 hypothetical protein [Streptomyces virginiae]MCX5582933.1 hypothetical protein [Streptomyces erythrochromogenes]